MIQAKNNLYLSPYNVILNLTTKCNLSCMHCFGDYSGGKELNICDLKKIVNELVKNKVFYINITGGEPTQHPNFADFIDYLGKKHMFFMLTSNAIFSDKILKSILRNKKWLINFKVSLDGPNAESYGFIRKKNRIDPNVLFNRAIVNVKKISKCNIPISVSTVLHAKNIMELEEFIPLFKKIKVSQWLLSPLAFIGRAEKNKEYLRYDNNINKLIGDILLPLIKKMNKEGISVELVDFPLSTINQAFHFICGAAISFCEIHSDGIVSPCALARLSMHEKSIKFDNILKKTLKKIWKGRAFNKFMEMQNKGCEGCVNIKNCNRCVPQSFLYFKNIDFPPPFCISIGKRLGLKNLKNIKNSQGYKKWKNK